MLDSVDAIRYLSQQLEDLNRTIANEQAISKRLATYSKLANLSSNNSSKLSGKVLDEFLKVTEIGSAKRLLQEGGRKSVKTSLASVAENDSRNATSTNMEVDVRDNEEAYISESYQNNQPKNVASEAAAGLSQKSSKLYESFSSPRIRPFRLYRMSWMEWGWAMWTAPTFADGWRIFREFRYAEDHSAQSNHSPTSRDDHNDDSTYGEDDGISGCFPSMRAMHLIFVLQGSKNP